jgi:hypothetical protein
MLDIDPGLDAKLRALFDHIEASSPPPGLAAVGTVGDEPRRRTFNLSAGALGVAVVAASVAIFAVELSGHHKTTPHPQGATVSPTPLPLARMPLLGSGGIATSAHVVIPLRHGQGSVQLPAFVPQGTLYIQFDCAGPGHFEIAASNHSVGNDLFECSNSLGATTMTVDSPKTYDAKPLRLDITADPAMRWEVFIAQSRAPLPQFTVNADQKILVSVTYGSGSTTLPTFSVGADESLNVRVACNSGSGADTVEMSGNPFTFGDEVQGACSNPSGASGGSGSTSVGGRAIGSISVHVKADPSISWEILITEGPGMLGVPSSADVHVAPIAYGMGSASLPAFTPTRTYSIAFVCSGPGPLTMVSSNFRHTTPTRCGGSSDYFTPPDQLPGQPVSLSVEASPSVGWEIDIYENTGSTNPQACPPFLQAGATKPLPCPPPSR